MEDMFSRTVSLIGEDALRKLKESRIILFGLGGVGSFTAEALVRSGAGSLTVVDSDPVSSSNINRQLCALNSTVGKQKTEIVKARLNDINPECEITVFNEFYLPENADKIDLSDYDYIADAIDTVSAKIELAVRAEKAEVPIISCMGTGNKLDPTLLRVSDIYKTEGCPLCRVMRRELKVRGVKHLKAVWSPEPPISPKIPVSGESENRHPPASMIFVPASAGILMAKEIICDLSGDTK